MRSNEDFDIGQEGIDTQYERDYINYRPKINYEKPQTDGSSGLSADTASQPDLLEEIGESSIISVWEDVVDIIGKINDTEKNVREKLNDSFVPISPRFQEAVKKAAERIGYSEITDRIPFELYKKTFENPESPDSSLIQDIYEEYTSDVQGNLNAELYTDVIEVKNDWGDMVEFVKKGLFAQVVPMDKVPRDISMDDTNLIQVEEKEEAMLEEYAALLKLRKVNEEIYMQLSSSEYGSDRYHQSVQELDDTKREIVKIEKRLFTKTEMVDLVRRKASDTEDSIDLIENSIDFDPYEGDKYEVLYGLLKQFGSKEKMQTGVRKMQAILKLSVDGKKMISGTMKSNLRGIAGGASKRRINRTLINGVHLRNEVFADVYDVMKHLDGVPNNSNFESMINHITDGVQQAELMYHQQASDFYKIHGMDAQLRNDKVVSLIDKDMARSTYKLMGNVLGYTKDVNQTWPAEENLSQWLNDFMEHTKLV